jgi:hypothetical protein
MRHLPVAFCYIADEPSEMGDEAQSNGCGKLEKTERFERVPNSIASRERFTAEWLDSP